MHEVHTMVKHNQLDMLVSTMHDDATSTAASTAISTAAGTGIGARSAYIKYATKKLQQKDLQNIIDDLFILDQVLTVNDVLIIVAKHAINETITHLLNQLWSQDGYFIIVFSLEQLQFNILEHQYVPVHEIMSDDETKKVIKKYNITNYDQLPNISRYDPVAQAIGIRPGQICKITRPSKTSIISYYYRVCT
jgi:DNA-directed RNA polymerase subunit H (RpoH/RPB5)